MVIIKEGIKQYPRRFVIPKEKSRGSLLMYSDLTNLAARGIFERFGTFRYINEHLHNLLRLVMVTN